MGSAAAPISLAATGLSAFSKIDAGDTAAQNAMGQAQNALDQAGQTKQYDVYKAKTLSDAAEYGRTSAAQTDADMRLQLSDKIANIAAVRGATGTDPTSPTGAAIMARTSAVADMNRQQTIGNIQEQTAQDQIGARYYRQAGIDALSIGQSQAAQYQANASADQTSGWLGALGAGLSGLAGLKLS